MPKSTPWGPAQSQRKLADGITLYTTASHGGIQLSNERYSRMPVLETPYSKNGWYEEDVDWAFVALTYPEAFNPEAIEAARNTLQWAYEGRYRWISKYGYNPYQPVV